MTTIMMLFGGINHIAAQQQISGQVFYQNSGKQPAIGVHVLGEDSNNDYSKDDGSYRITFEEKKVGDRFDLAIADKDGYGKRILLTNLDAISQFRIPRDPKDHFDLIVVDSLVFAERKAKIADDILRLKQKELQKLRNELVEKSNAEQQNADERKQLIEKIQILEKNLISKDKELEKKAEFISLINLDDVSHSVSNAINKMETASEVDEVLVFLDRDKLYQQQRDYQQKIIQHPDSIPKFKQELEAIYVANELRKNLLLSVNRFSDAVLCFQDQILIREQNLIDTIQLAVQYVELSRLLYKIGRYREAKGYALKTQQLEATSEKLKILRLLADWELISIEYELSDHKDLMLLVKESAPIIKQMILAGHSSDWSGNEFQEDKVGATNLLLMFNNFVGIIEKLNDGPTISDICEIYKPYDKAYAPMARDSLVRYYRYFYCEEKSNTVLIEDVQDRIAQLGDNTNYDLYLRLDYYEFLRILYYYEGEDVKSLDAIEKAIQIRESISNQDDVHELVELYLAYGNYYLNAALTSFLSPDLPQELYKPKAIAYFEKALALQQEQLSQFNFELANSYFYYANFNFEFGEMESALNLIQKAINIKRSHLSALSYELDQEYSLLFSIYEAQQRYDLSLEVLEKQIRSNQAYLPPNNYDLYFLKLDKSIFHLEQKQYEPAMENLREMVAILRFNEVNGTGEFSKEENERFLEKQEALFAEIYARSGDLKNGTKVWKKHLQKYDPSDILESKMELQLGILRMDIEVIKKYLAVDEYISLDPRFTAFPESIEFLEDYKAK